LAGGHRQYRSAVATAAGQACVHRPAPWPLRAFEYLYSETHSDGKGHDHDDVQKPRGRGQYAGGPADAEITKEGLGQRSSAPSGSRNLQLESEEFNRAFKIKTAQNKFAYDGCTPG